ncbi:type II toxin-antitoxin system HipA family toxin YjjJ [Stenotrophomonas sp.]|uniref:type II toxin-antitoxin system HipA family toxin YjjJ n=1 Tax=Stenotrophomonas sp. TaxID=69392 RepID=UPI0028B1DF43|nr:type II toxin-antitoxin system HipA family toxin YjjJ [Stenotrophomonas sp.]
MARPSSASVLQLLDLLQSGEPVPAGELVEKLAVSRPVLSRLVAEAGDQVRRIGKARATAYVATALVRPNTWPLYRMGPEANMEELGTLHALRGDGFLLEPTGDRPNLMRAVDGPAGYFPGLPWFLDDVRPQGFLGRSLAHRLGRALGVPADLKSWQSRDNLLGILHGGTSVGDLLLGQAAIDRALLDVDAPPDRVDMDSRHDVYAIRAKEALDGEEVGSSPGGEQPKFTATVVTATGRYAALVKFALSSSNALGARWADLLVCEHLALTTLREAGFPAARTQLLRSDEHVFLEVERFDRTADELGRRGFVSLLALDAAFIGEGTRDWGLAGEQLVNERLITQDTADNMARLHWFGRLIGNTDMHLGNIGFDLIDSGPLPLRPAYDMLPMYLAPSAQSGNVRAPALVSINAPNRTGQAAFIAWAAQLAVQFWQQVAEAEVAPEIQAMAQQNIDVVRRYALRFDS